MRNKYLISLLFLLSLNLLGCYEDKGRYDYIQMDDVEITLDKVIYAVPMGDMLTVKAEIKLKNGSTDLSNMEYKWSVNGETHEGWDKPILEWVTDRGIVDGTLVLEVKDRKSGICFYKNASVNVTGIYNLDAAWVILSEKNNETYISLFKVTDYSYSDDWMHIIINEAEVMPDVYKKSDGEAVKRPIKMVEHYCVGNNYVGPFLLLQHGSAPIDLNGETMEKDLDFNLAFAGGKVPDGEEIVDANFSKYSDILVGKTGKLYSRFKTDQSLFNSGKYLDEPLKLDGEVLEQCAVVKSIPPGWGSSLHLLHDKKNERMLVIDEYDGRIYPYREKPANAPANFVSLDDLSGCNLLSISYMLNGFYFEHRFNMILKKDGKYLYQEFKTDEYGNLNSIKAMEITGLTEDPTCIETAPKSGYILIAIREKLYIFDPVNPHYGIESYLDFDSDIISMDATNYDACILSTKSRFFIVDNVEMKNNLPDKRVLYSSPEGLDLGEIKQVLKKHQKK